MTYPHVDPQFKKKDNVPYYLTEEYQKQVFEVNNAVMECRLNCKVECDCLECGNADCFAVFERQAKLWGMTLHELMKSWKEQREKDNEAAELQQLRYEEYADNPIVKQQKKKKHQEEGLFDLAA